jgi:hypothetical protein
VNLPGRTFPHWFLNFGEVADILAAEGYRVASDALAERFYDQANLPPTHRIERFRNTLFVRREPARGEPDR